jgi:Xaa-Pro dipeptidase
MIESHTLDHVPGKKWIYRGWREFEDRLEDLSLKGKRIAMEYSPCNALPIISKVDAGTVELVRKKGAEVVSSANLLQNDTIWTPEQLAVHLEAADALNQIAEATWAFISLGLRNDQVLTDYRVQQFMLEEMEKRGLVTADPPICAVNAYSADPHYAPTLERAEPIQAGDFILIDLWCKKKKERSVYADIARVGVAAERPTDRQRDIFDIVKKARHAATDFIKDRLKEQKSIQGWEVDQICRDVIAQAGYGDYFIHRTGHNIGEHVHGPGANLDNFETHDVRCLLPGTCFSIEPGIYLPDEFGVRLEYDVYLDGEKVLITGGIQEQIECLLV